MQACGPQNLIWTFQFFIELIKPKMLGFISEIFVDFEKYVKNEKNPLIL